METEPDAELSRDPHYQQRIDATRVEIEDLRQSELPEEEVVELAREKAAILRMEVILDQAQLTRSLIEYLYVNPEVTPERFMEIAQASRRVYNPDATRKFIASMLECRDAIDLDLARTKANALGWANKQYQTEYPGEDPENPSDPERFEKILKAQEAYHLLNVSLKEPEGEIEISKRYPLAVEVYFQSKADFKKMDNRDIGGFYRSKHRTWSAELNQRFPLIVTYVPPRPSDYYRIVEHEEKHSHNDQLKRALAPDDVNERSGNQNFTRKIIWSRLESSYADKGYYNDIGQVADMQVAGKDFTKLEAFDRLVSFALSRAKDEIIAFATTADSARIKGLLTARGGIYDYFAYAQSENTVYEKLWADFEPKLTRAIEIVQKFENCYKQSKLYNRFELFLTALAMVPIEDWQETLDDNYFEKEILKLEAIGMANSNKMYLGEISELEYYRLDDEITALLSRHQTEPLTEAMEEAARLLGFSDFAELVKYNQEATEIFELMQYEELEEKYQPDQKVA